MNDILFYGKLKNRRDFVQSPSLPYDEKIFWANWFDNCVISKSLPNFLKQRSSNKIWAFVYKIEHSYRVGAITLSCDSSGRSYPFLVYQIFSEESFDALVMSRENFSLELGRMILMLKNAIESDVVSACCSDDICYQELLPPELQHKINEFIEDSYDKNLCSCWVELSTHLTFDIYKQPTCSFYSKLFG